MIVVDPQVHRIWVTVYGEFTLADYREFELAVSEGAPSDPPFDLLFDLREMDHATLDVVWEDFQFGRRHVNDFRRIAIVTDSQWIVWSAWLAQVFFNADVKIFEDPETAQAWLAAQ